MFDRIGSESDRIDNVLAVAGVNCDRQFLRMRFIDHGAQNVHIHPVERISRHARFEDALDGIDMLRGEFIHLFARFLSTLRRPNELRIE